MSSRAEVVVVGAGLAGLSAATRLAAAGCDVQVFEAAPHAGGRLATRRIDGFVVDRGFQVLNSGYPRAADLDLDLDALDLGFVRGRIGLPAAGMQAVGEQLAARLPAGRLRLSTAVRTVSAGTVVTDTGTWTADAVVVATDPGTAARLLPMVEAAAPRQVTTHLHVLPESPWTSPLIVLGGPGGRLVNSVVLSDAQPRYSPDGRALVASSTLEPTTEEDVRREIASAHDVSPSYLEHLTSITVTGAQPAALPPLRLRQPVDLGEGLYVCGDHRDTPSIQGAMASGARTARAVLRGLRPAALPVDRKAS